MQFVEEGDDLSLRLLDLVEHGFEPFLELTAVFGAGNYRAEVERDDPLRLQPLGDVTIGDTTGQAFDDRSLSNPGLADEDRVVLGPSREDLDHASNLIVTTNDRVELALAGDGGEVTPILLQSVEGGFGIIGGDTAGAADPLQRLQDGGCGEPDFTEEIPNGALSFR